MAGSGGLDCARTRRCWRRDPKPRSTRNSNRGQGKQRISDLVGFVEDEGVVAVDQQCDGVHVGDSDGLEGQNTSVRCGAKPCTRGLAVWRVLCLREWCRPRDGD
ncbi:hypothetical protein Dimus_003767 [Dionaea muscipula]